MLLEKQKRCQDERNALLGLEMSEKPDGIEQKTQHSIKLQKALELDGSPVAVAILSEPPDGLEHLQRKATPCMMVQIARRGLAFYSSGDGILCGGRANLGVGGPPVNNLDDFLVRKEKLFVSKAAARKLIDLARKRAPEKGEHLVFSPLEQAGFMPDVVLLVGKPAQISRIIFLNAFTTGEFDTTHGEPLCSGTIAMPITTGRIGVSFLDMACRLFGRYKPEEMVVGVPYRRLLSIVDNIDLSSAGTARPSLFIRLAGNLLRRYVPENSE